MRKVALVLCGAALVEVTQGFSVGAQLGLRGDGVKAMAARSSAVRFSSLPLLAKKKKAKAKGSTSITKGGVSEAEITDLESDAALMTGGLADAPMMPDGGLPMPSEGKESGIKDLIRDRSLESKFVPIPKGAIAPDPREKEKEKENEEEALDSAFGLPGPVLRFIKNGTWACIALLVFAEVVARTPLIEQLSKGANEAERSALLERRELDKAGKALPGVRPWAPVGGLKDAGDAGDAGK
mmetsp:Transcript_36334/g.56778  ORF Transcript_36334/g.56778 Transcript_36334/m.56778 type:complete len:239 (-) Transcript_36334:1001-1717(-)